jgi:DNA-binding NarL/FixJ family response regulator
LILRYLEAGAAGCIREQDSSEDLVQGLRLAAARQVALNADLFPLVMKRVSSLANEQRNTRTANAVYEKSLTRREREILQLLAQGCCNREIARHLTIELGTAKNHVHNILDKLNVKNRRDAAVYYALGLV